MRQWLVVFVCLVALIFVGASSANSENLKSNTEFSKKDNKDYVKTWVEIPDKRVVKHTTFKPESEPNPTEVKDIIASENDKWGGPSIYNRVACESEFRWNASNGSHFGLLQFATDTWYSMYTDQIPKRVEEKVIKHDKKKVWRYFLYADGHRERHSTHKINVKIIKKKVGHLDPGAGPYNGYAAIRVGQMAASGQIATTAWSCSL